MTVNPAPAPSRLKVSIPGRLHPSAVALVLANVAPLYGVLFLNWEIFPIALLYWFENVVVGVFNVLRMIAVAPRDFTRWIGKLVIIPFFVVHYGMFTTIHGVFVLAIFGNQFRSGKGFPGPATFSTALWESGAAAAAVGIIGSHAFSFAWNYLRAGEYQSATLETLMSQPYGRVVVLHLVVLFGGWIVLLARSPMGGLILLIALKIAVDLRAHVREHVRATATIPDR